LSRIERRRRIRCRLACELLGEKRTSTRSSVVTLSEGGFAFETLGSYEVGEAIRLCILPHRRERAVKVSGIVWNDRAARGSAASLRVFGCVVSEPPSRFAELLKEVAVREEPQTAGLPSGGIQRLAQHLLEEASSPGAEPELPRSRAPLPPPKPDAEENLPRFRVRLKQVGGSRTRTVEVHATSRADARERTRAELSESGFRWLVLQVVPCRLGSDPVRP
jgi:hypothetical protein